MAKKLKITNNIRKLRFFFPGDDPAGAGGKGGDFEADRHCREAGKYSPSLELAFRIADAFGVEIGEVFAHEPEDTDTNDDSH
jgi:putative transcriptional regulator